MHWDLREYMNLFDRVKGLGLKSLQAVEATHDRSGDYFIVGSIAAVYGIHYMGAANG